MTQLTAMVKVRKAFEQVAVLDLMGELTSSAEAPLLNAYEEVSNDGALVSNIWYNAQLRTLLFSPIAALRRIRRQFGSKSGR